MTYDSHKIIDTGTVYDATNPRITLECSCGELTDVGIVERKTKLVDTSIEAIEAHVHHIITSFNAGNEELANIISDLIDYVDLNDDYGVNLVSKAQDAAYFLRLGDKTNAQPSREKSFSSVPWWPCRI